MLYSQYSAIQHDLNINNYRDLKNILNKKKISQLIVNDGVSIDVNIVYLLSKAALKNIEIHGIDTSTEIWKKLQTLNHKRSLPINDIEFNILHKGQSIIESVFIVSNAGQSKLKIYFFCKFLYTYTIANILIFSILFFNLGFASIFTIFKKLMTYRVEYDTPTVLYYGIILLVVPYLSSMILVMQSATSTCALIKIKTLNEEPLTLSMFDLSMEQTYFQPIILSFAISAIIMHVIALFFVFLGCGIAWYIQTGADLISFLADKLDRCIKGNNDIIHSLIKSGLSGAWIGYCVCACGMYPGSQAQVVISSVNQCVLYSIAGISIVHILGPIIDICKNQFI
jgi:ABC-type transporter Mla maintaining outer membrane lipid asymmetry permease subunit MlaE